MNMNLIYRAMKFAVEKHHTQKRGGKGVPYVLHTIDVANDMWSSGFDEPVQMAALLHDVVEDQYPATPEGIATGLTEVNEHFGEEVARMVAWLTLPIDCRRPHEKVLHQVAMMKEMNDGARAIKIGDKKSNVSDLQLDPPPWGRNAKLGYAADAEKVVNAALIHSFDVRIASLVRQFEQVHTNLRLSLGENT